MDLPIFSVVIPAYNRADSILPTLRSVQRQTVADFECIVVDDGSRDSVELLKIVESLDDTRFRYRWRPNGGGGAARNTGMDEARGKWIAFLDSDDIWLPEKLEADLREAAPDLVLFSQVLVVRSGKTCEIHPARGPRAGENLSEYLVRRQGWTQTSTMVVPAPCPVRFSEKARYGQDTDFALRLAHAGLSFRMHSRSRVQFVDDEGSRVSRNLDWRSVDAWLDEVSSMMTPAAVRAYRGWHVARMAASSGEWRVAFAFYGRALASGALPPALAVKALVQLLVSRGAYRSGQRAMHALRPGVRLPS